MTKPADNVIIVCQPELNIYDSLKEKLLELRSKRDAVLMSHKQLKQLNDVYNKAIIYLSLIAACFETVKAQLKLTERNDFIAPMAILAPIFITTGVTIISSLLKFKKFPEKMECNTKASEKAYYAITRIRALLENLNFDDDAINADRYASEVMVYYRDALDAIERTVYPRERSQLFEQAQRNLITISDNEFNYSDKLYNIEMKKLNLEEKNLLLSKKRKDLFIHKEELKNQVNTYSQTPSPDPDTGSLPRPAAKSSKKSVPTPATKPVPKPATKPVPKPAPKKKPEVDPESEPDVEPDVEPDDEPDAEPDADAEPDDDEPGAKENVIVPKTPEDNV